jgi:hypothetical protein
LGVQPAARVRVRVRVYRYLGSNQLPAAEVEEEAGAGHGGADKEPEQPVREHYQWRWPSRKAVIDAHDVLVEVADIERLSVDRRG